MVTIVLALSIDGTSYISSVHSIVLTVEDMTNRPYRQERIAATMPDKFVGTANMALGDLSMLPHGDLGASGFLVEWTVLSCRLIGLHSGRSCTETVKRHLGDRAL